MKFKSLFCSVITVVIGINTCLAAANPNISIVFTDPDKVCKTQNATEFSFNYSYTTDTGVEYFSGPVYINKSSSLIKAPTPNQENYKYSSFAITDAGMCGDLDINYSHRGDCYGVNLISTDDQNHPYSYKITIIPQKAPDQDYGKSYNFRCTISKY